MKQRAFPKVETLEVEFKSDLNRLSDNELIDTIVALTNSNGGELYIGVEDDGTPTGVHKAHADATKLAAFIANKTIPPVPARVTPLKLDENGMESMDGKTIVGIEVPRSKAIVATSDGKILRRRIKMDGTPESVPLYPYEIITRLGTIGQLDYSAFPLPSTSMDDFNPEELLRLRSILEHNRSGDQALIELDDNEMLTALHMATLVEGKPVPTVTGILLAGKKSVIERAMPTAQAAFQVLEGTDVRINQDFSGPLLNTIEKIGAMLEAWNPEHEYEDGLFRISVPEFDRRAIREALVNAFGHRDYASQGRVRILIDDEGLTIANPGGFVEGVTLDNLLTVEPHGRNECLMNALKRIGLAEKTGRGIDRIYEGSLVYGRPLPDYTGSTTTNISLFLARSAPDELFMKMLADEQARTGKTLSLRSLLILDALKKQRRLTISDLSQQLHFTDITIRATIEALVESGLVEARGNSKARTYMLSSQVYRAAGKNIDYVRQTDINKVRNPEMIMQLAKQQDGRVTTRDVMELLHLDRKQAYRQLKKLVDDDKLMLNGGGRAYYYTIVE